MIITVDTNIIISALINSSGTEFSILKHEFKHIDFISSRLLIEEFSKKIHKISSLTHSSPADLLFQYNSLTEKLFLIDDKEIDSFSIKRTKKLMEGLDEKDFLFLAVSICFDALLWTGDLKLRHGLKRKGYKNIVTTKELKDIIRGL